MEAKPRPDALSLPADLSPERVREAAREFTWIYHELKAQTFATTTWLRVPLVKTPADIVVFQQIIAETLPEVIVETGVYVGGSAMLFASLQEALGIDGKVIAVDVDLSVVHESVRDHPRIELIEGSSTDPEILERIRRECEGRRVMVDLDSDHRAHHVLEELRMYSELVSPGSYLVVEDGFMGGRPVRPDAVPGPSEALEAWFADDPPFEVDRWRERFLLTQNPRGYLRRHGELEGAPRRPERPEGFVTGEFELTPGAGEAGGGGPDPVEPARPDGMTTPTREADNEVEALREWAAAATAGSQPDGSGKAPAAAEKAGGTGSGPVSGPADRSIENLLAELEAQREVLHERTRLLARERAHLKRIQSSRPYRVYQGLRSLPGIRQIADRRDRRRTNRMRAKRAQRAKVRGERGERFIDSHRGQ